MKKIVIITIVVLMVLPMIGGRVLAQDTLGLEVFNMELDAVTVSAKAKANYKRLGKKQKMFLIEEFKQKLVEDFPERRNEYNVLSGYRLLQDTVVMASGNMTGKFVENPSAKRDDEKVQIVDAKYDEYLNPVLAENMKKMEEMEKNYAKEAGGDGRTQQEIHKLLWGMTPPATLEALEDLKGKWDYIPNGDGTSYVVFRGHKGFMGIVSVEWKINYLVDAKTLGLIKLTESLDAKVSIPFGVGVKGEDLEMLNMLNIAYGNFDSFKFRKGELSVKRYVEYTEVAGDAGVAGAASGSNTLRRPVSKILDSFLIVTGKQDKEIAMKAAANAKVL